MQCIAKEIIYDLIYKLDVVVKIFEKLKDTQSEVVKELVNEIKKEYNVINCGENTYLNKVINSNKKLTDITADVWLKNAIVDFAIKTKIWIPKKFDVCKKIKFLNGCI